MPDQDQHQVLPCEMDPERWFAETGTKEGLQRVRSAIAACKTCPALEACMEYSAKVKPQYGVWAARNYTKTRRSRNRGEVSLSV